jgi:hypothetical protein
LLLWLRQWWADYDSSPTLREASSANGISMSAIDGQFRRMQLRGLMIPVLNPTTGRCRGWRLSMAGEILCRQHSGDVQPVRPQPIADKKTLINRLLFERERALRRRYHQLKTDRDARAFLAWLEEHVNRELPK